jgi:hypothetical protein
MRRLAAIGAVALGVAACGGSGNSYPANVQSNFLNACEMSASVSVCDCALKNIENQVPLAQFVQAERTLKQTGTLPEKLRSAALSCVGK